MPRITPKNSYLKDSQEDLQRMLEKIQDRNLDKSKVEDQLSQITTRLETICKVMHLDENKTKETITTYVNHIVDQAKTSDNAILVSVCEDFEITMGSNISFSQGEFKPEIIEDFFPKITRSYDALVSSTKESGTNKDTNDIELDVLPSTSPPNSSKPKP